MISPARAAAHTILERVAGGAYASELLAAHTFRDPRDARLASEIVLGCLRRQAQLDWIVGGLSGGKRLDLPVLVALRMGVYQLRHLDRVPAHAVVNDAVELVKRARKRSATGLVNALLRRVPAGDVEWPSREVAWSTPEWLLARWDAQYGSETAVRIARTFLAAPETYVRHPPANAAVEIQPTDVPGAYRVVSGDASNLRIQDVGSQSVVPLLDLQPGMTFLDVCAAPGNKTAQALESGVSAIACDIHLHRIRRVEGCARVALDATAPMPFRRHFDRILVDAPCSGTGTLAHHPEIKWRLRPEDIEDLHARQTAILRNALDLLAPDGRLVYSTCSLERRENEDVVAASGARVLETRQRIPGRDEGEGFFAAALAR